MTRAAATDSKGLNPMLEPTRKQRFGRTGAAVSVVIGIAAGIGLALYGAISQLWASLPAVVAEAMRESLMLYLALFTLIAIGVVVAFGRHRVAESRQREAEKQLAQERERLSDVVELVGEGLALFDKEDRLVLCNRIYRGISPDVAKIMTPGVPFRDLVRSLCESEEIDAIADQTRQVKSSCVERHEHYREPFEMRLRDGRTLRVSEHRLSAGETLRMQSDVTELKRAQSSLQRLSTHDSLTGLLNRSFFEYRLEQALARSRRHGNKVAVLVVDLDRFKWINESLGYGAGDKLLSMIADCLRRHLRGGDTLARLGSDEFAVILERIDAWTESSASAQRILQALSSPITLGGSETVVSASIGIALFPEDAADGYTLLRNADAARRQAKRKGPNSYQYFTEDVNAKAVARFTLEKHLRDGLKNDELHVHYQPAVELASRRIVGMEALLRWKSPQLGQVPPDRFIPIAEQTGLISPIGEWVLKEACAQTKAWRERGLEPGRVFVNVSPSQFRLQNLEELVPRVLEETGLTPAEIGLEITETVLMDDVASALDTTRTLSAMGVKMVVDDFGIGYSSFSRLRRFPVKALKIDRTFVRDITTDPEALKIVSAIIATAHNLQITAVAEGVETRQQLSLLEARGCDEVQGFYLGRPAPAAAAARFLERDLRAH